MKMHFPGLPPIPVNSELVLAYFTLRARRQQQHKEKTSAAWYDDDSKLSEANVLGEEKRASRRSSGGAASTSSSSQCEIPVLLALLSKHPKGDDIIALPDLIPKGNAGGANHTRDIIRAYLDKGYTHFVSCALCETAVANAGENQEEAARELKAQKKLSNQVSGRTPCTIGSAGFTGVLMKMES
jgi:hypothetical protein